MSDETLSAPDVHFLSAPRAIRVDPSEPEPTVPDHEGHGDESPAVFIAEAPAVGSTVMYRSASETAWPATVLGVAAAEGRTPVLDLEVHERTGNVRVQAAPFSEAAVAGTWFHPQAA